MGMPGFRERMRERDRRIGPINFVTKLNDLLLSPHSRLTTTTIRGDHWVEYTLTLLPGRKGPSVADNWAHNLLLHTITVKTLCQMERVAPTETPHRS